MLRNLSRNALKHLTQLFNHLLRLGHFPTIWKSAKVIPIPKPDKPHTDRNSYRPISLLSTLGKLFERIIAARLTSFVQQHQLIPHFQFGFHMKHTTVAQLARIIDYITNGFNLHKHTGMLLLDIEKAYDTVWITGLLYKLITLKVPMYLLWILTAFLTEPNFTVHVNDESSSIKTTPAGLPQGAVLSTSLFSLYISDISHPPNSHLALYADGTAILTQSWRTDTIVNRLTQASTTLLRYFTKWKLRINVRKTEAILFTKRRPPVPTPVHFQLTAISWSIQVRYLGVILDSKLLFTRHIITVTHRASSALLRLFPLVARYSTLSFSNKLTLYKLISAPYSFPPPSFGVLRPSTTTDVYRSHNLNAFEWSATTPDAPPSH